MLTKQNSSLFGTGKLTAEFTQGQLVIGSCAMLFIALLCFVVGMITGRSQASKDAELRKANAGGAVQTAAVPMTGPVDAQAKPPATPPARDQGVQTSPRTDLLERPSLPQTPKTEIPPAAPTAPAGPSTPEAAKPAPVAPASSATPASSAAAPLSASPPAPASTPSAVRTGDKTVLPPLPPIPKTASEIQRSMQTAHAPAAQPTSPPVQVVPLPGAVTPDPSSAPPIPATVKQAAAPKPAAVPEPTGTTPAAKPAAPAKGKFGIQVAAFQGAGRDQKAAECQKRLKANGGYETIVLTANNGTACQVIISGYKDRPSAQKVLAELKKKPGFSDAWIKEIP